VLEVSNLTQPTFIEVTAIKNLVHELQPYSEHLAPPSAIYFAYGLNHSQVFVYQMISKLPLLRVLVSNE